MYLYSKNDAWDNDDFVGEGRRVPGDWRWNCNQDDFLTATNHSRPTTDDFTIFASMYDLPYFKAHDEQDVLDFMKTHPFITLCGVDGDGKPVATHVPVLFVEKDGKLLLRAHIMRKTGHHKAFEANPNVLAIFTGPHSYVSSSWYTDPSTGSTWNYQAVHVSGIMHFGDNAMLYALLTDLTAHFENNPHSPSQVKNLSPEYVEQNMKAIIAFEIEITDIKHVFKLSQNRDIESRNNIISKLATSNDPEAQMVAEEMKKHYTAP